MVSGGGGGGEGEDRGGGGAPRGGGSKERLGRGMPPFDDLRSLNPEYPGSTPGMMSPRPLDNVPVLDKI